MAKKRRFNPFKRVARRAVSAVRRIRRGRSAPSVSPLMKIAYGAGYGFLRGQASSFVNQKIAPMIPFGQYSDEIVFAGASYFMAKSGNATVKALGNAGLVIEGALIGSQIGQSVNLFGSASAPAQTSNQMTSFK